jgi:hypothetical protein
MGLTRPRAEQIFNLDYKQAVRAVATADINLTGGAPSQVDGVNLSKNDRVLVVGQTTGIQNGLYLVSVAGSGASGTWVRTSDGNENGEIEAGMIVMVTEGIMYADTQWKLITDNPIVVGSTPLTFTQNYSANSISGGTSNVTVYSNANVVISSAGTANVLTVSSTGAYILGQVSTTGNVTSNYFIGNGSQLTGIVTTYDNSNVVTLLANFGSNSISTTGNVTAKNLNSSNADLAEMYVADANYASGTVVEFGGNCEITATRSGHSAAVAGIISTAPSYLMNSTQEGIYVLPVALVGRVPCRVVGTVHKGDRLVSSNLPGVAQALNINLYQPGCIVGKALEEYNSVEPGVIEVAVGRS